MLSRSVNFQSLLRFRSVSITQSLELDFAHRGVVLPVPSNDFTRACCLQTGASGIRKNGVAIVGTRLKGVARVD